MRVLCPNGVAYVKKDGEWVKSVKPRPEEMDEWTHYLHDASGNPVAHDSAVGPPRRLQWVGSPKWARHHDHMASMSALVSSNDRIFYIFDEGPTSSIQLPSKWFLIARDAFNGTILWKRPISKWNTHLWPLKSGPAQITRRLVAAGDTVYVTLGIDEPLTALDAATGEPIRTYDGTRSTEEIINADGVLFLLVNELPNEWVKFRPKHTYVWDNTGRANRKWAWDEKKRRIMAVEANTGKILWKKEYLVAPLTLAADQESVYFHDGEKSVVIAGDKAFVASIDTHTVYALDADTGKIGWSYTAGGRVDSPPTIYQGLVLFGSVDGWVYCLRASDGALIWRFRAGPVDQRLMAFEQLESVWPVHGSVLVQDNTVRFVAGRSMFLDGGLRLFQLDPKTGHKISETVLDDRDPETGDNLQVRVKGLNMPVALPDVLSYDGNYVYMRSQRFDMQGNRQEIGPINVTEQVGEGTHLFSPVGFLDDTWFHRSYWMFGRNVASGWGGWFRAGRFVPSGRILVFDDSSVYGYGRRPEYLSQSSVLEYQLFSASKQIKAESIRRVQAGSRRMNATSSKNNVHAADWKARKDFPLADRTAADFRWWQGSPPLQVRAMILADKTLFMAGPPDVANEEQAFYAPDDEEVLAKLNEQSEALEGEKGALLWVVSTADGKKLAERKLDSPPVFDGMAASNGRLYLATMDGKVLCFAGK